MKSFIAAALLAYATAKEVCEAPPGTLEGITATYYNAGGPISSLDEFDWDESKETNERIIYLLDVSSGHLVGESGLADHVVVNYETWVDLKAGEYEWSVTSDDGSRLFIDDV